MKTLTREQLKRQIYQDLFHDADILNSIRTASAKASSQKTTVLDDINQLRMLVHNTDKTWVLISKYPFRYYLPISKYRICTKLRQEAEKADHELKVSQIIDKDCIVLSRSQSSLQSVKNN